MRFKRIFASLASCLLLLTSVATTTAFAEVALPDGAVKGLPERLAALDDQGNAVNSATGEYFFHVENMKYGETYTKSVQLMNLREDASYYIYFYVEPLYKDGEIDLEKGCECTFYLDGNEFYKGDVNGKGNIDLSSTYYECGFFNPGDSHVLKASVIWNDIDVIKNVDNGHRLIDKDGEHVLVGSDDSGYAEGEIEFKWIFFASILPIDQQTDIQTTTTQPSTGDNMTETSSVNTEVLSTTDATDTGHTTDHSTPNSSTTTYTTTVSTETTTNPPGGFFNTPFTGYLASDGKVWLIAMGVIGVLIVFMLILIHRDKKKREKK